MNLYLFRGIPGSGKSTLARTLAQNGNFYEICTDDCWDWDYTTDPRGFDTDELMRAHRRCQADVEAHMAAGDENIIVHNTFVRDMTMTPYRKLAEQYGYRVFVLTVENRHNGKSVHNVPEETIEKMRESFKVKL